jgi:hypothetical protein
MTHFYLGLVQDPEGRSLQSWVMASWVGAVEGHPGDRPRVQPVALRRSPPAPLGCYRLALAAHGQALGGESLAQWGQQLQQAIVPALGGEGCLTGGAGIGDPWWDVELDPQGYLVWHLHPRGVAQWWSRWLAIFPLPLLLTSSLIPPRSCPWPEALIWQMQRSHGDCCRVGEWAAEWGEPKGSRSQGLSWGDPRSWPWDTPGDTGSAGLPLGLWHPSQGVLLDRLVDWVDALVWKPDRSPGLLPPLLRAWDQAYRCHPLGAVYREQPPDRWGCWLAIVALTQRIFAWSLGRYHLPAPSAL